MKAAQISIDKTEVSVIKEEGKVRNGGNYFIMWRGLIWFAVHCYCGAIYRSIYLSRNFCNNNHNHSITIINGRDSSVV